MKPSQKVKQLFAQLPSESQVKLLDGLLQEEELCGKILSNKGSRDLCKKPRKRGNDFKANKRKKKLLSFG